MSEDANQNVIDQNIADNTIIIFDWDDTLLPSSQVSELDPLTLSQATIDALMVCEKSVINVLSHVVNIFKHVYVVTNAEDKWVELSMQKYYRVLQHHNVLEKVLIISARSNYQHKNPSDPMQWKYYAMYDISMSVFGNTSGSDLSNHQSQNRKQIISFGDNHSERNAVLGLSKIFPDIYTKSVKFTEHPEIHRITEQLDTVKKSLKYLTEYPGHLDLCLNSAETQTQTQTQTQNHTQTRCNESTDTVHQNVEQKSCTVTTVVEVFPGPSFPKDLSFPTDPSTSRFKIDEDMTVPEIHDIISNAMNNEMNVEMDVDMGTGICDTAQHEIRSDDSKISELCQQMQKLTLESQDMVWL